MYCLKSDKSQIVKILCANKFAIIMCFRSIILCFLNCIIENIQITEGHITPTGSMLASPDLRYRTYAGCFYLRVHPFRPFRNGLRNIYCTSVNHKT